jgi:parvulin-like peptidyl-prolyl isomerase
MTFNEAAREHSLDKAGRSGLLGWKRRDELDQDFWAGALAVPTGEYTKEPVKTQYGYHIIKVESKK